MRSEIKELSAHIDVLDNRLATLKGMLSPVMHMGSTIGVLATLSKEEVDTRSEVSKSISALSSRVRSLVTYVDDMTKNLDIGEE
jgi:hypothetical protein